MCIGLRMRYSYMFMATRSHTILAFLFTLIQLPQSCIMVPSNKSNKEHFNRLFLEPMHYSKKTELNTVFSAKVQETLIAEGLVNAN